MAWTVNPLRVGNLRSGDAAVEYLSVGLVADGVDVGAAMLHADDYAGGAAAYAQLVGPVVVTVPAMEEVGVARWWTEMTGIP